MKLLKKSIFVSILSILVQGCASNISFYQSTSSKQATIILDIPHKYHSSVSILVDDNSNYYDPYTLLYGKDIFNTLNDQTIYNNQVKIDADKKLVIRVYYEIPLNQNCDLKFDFTPESGEKYWFGISDRRSPKKNFIRGLITGPSLGTCYVGIAKYVGKELEFIQLDLKKGNPV